MIKVINKGYTLTVDSWENDGDNSRTLSKTVATKEEAKVWWNLIELCSSAGLGNSDEFSEKQSQAIINFIEQNELIFQRERLNEIKEESEEFAEVLEEWFCDIIGELLGYSGYYLCRVVESVVITYSPEDIYLEEIKF